MKGNKIIPSQPYFQIITRGCIWKIKNEFQVFAYKSESRMEYHQLLTFDKRINIGVARELLQQVDDCVILRIPNIQISSVLQQGSNNLRLTAQSSLVQSGARTCSHIHVHPSGQQHFNDGSANKNWFNWKS